MTIKKIGKGHEVIPLKPVSDSNSLRPGQDQYDKNKPPTPPYVIRLSPESRAKQREEESHPKEWYKRFLELFYK